MSNDDRFGLVDWLTLKRRLDFGKARWLGPLFAVVATLLVVLAVGTAFTLLGRALFGGLLDVPGSSLGVGGVTVALIGAPFVIWRSIVAQKQADIAEQGQITDRINKAVEGLGAEKTVRTHRRDSRGQLLYHAKEGSSHNAGKDLDFKRPVITELTEPNLEVRLGAIYALERISQDSARDHIQIMEILCAYIRQNAGRETVSLPDSGVANEPVTVQQWTSWRGKSVEHPRQDVDVGLRVIERRSENRKQLERDKGYRLGLERQILRKLILSKRDMSGADLRDAELQGAEFVGSILKGAAIEDAQLQAASLSRADLRGAYANAADFTCAWLFNVKLNGARLINAIFDSAVLIGVKMQGAELMNARMQHSQLSGADARGANFIQAKFQGAQLQSARFEGCDLRHIEIDQDTNFEDTKFFGAAVCHVNFADSSITANQLSEMFGDASVRLPGGHGPKHHSWPKHWPKFNLPPQDFETEWRKWQADPDIYTPPDPPKPDA